MENITIAPEERESLITEMKREAKPSRRLRMHIALLASRRALPDRDRPCPLLLLSTTVYAVASRFNGEGRAAFDDRRARGPRPLLGEAANERLEKLIEEDSPTYLFMKLLNLLRRTYRSHKQSCTWPQTTTQAMPASESRSTWMIREGASGCILCVRGLLRAIRWSWCGGLCMRS